MKTKFLLWSSLVVALSAQAWAAPGKPNIAWMPSTHENGQSVTVRWDMWWGENGNQWSLVDNGQAVCTGALIPNGQNAQSASCVADYAAGTHEIVVSLCNASGCTPSNPFTLTVAGGGGGQPGEPDTTGWPQPLKQNNKAYQPTTTKQVGAYFVEWGIYGRDYHVADIPSTNLTHLYYGFIPVCGPNESLRNANPQGYSALTSQCQGKQDYQVVVHDKFAALEKSYPGDRWDQPIRGNFGQLRRLSAAQPDLVILPSVGGWTLSDPLYDIGTNPAAREVFIESIIAFIQTYDFFDGIDIDWEFPGGGGANPALGSPQDGVGFATLMKELRQALDNLSMQTGRTYQLTAAMSGGVEKLSKVDWEQAAQYMDHINLMTYDYYGAWNGTLGHQTGLYPAPDAAIAGFSAHEAVNYLLSRNVPREKLSLGVAMYGRGWTNVTGGQPTNPFTGTGGAGISGSWERGIEDYKVIETQYMGGVNGTGANGFTYFWDDIAKASYVWDYAKGTLISFDSPRSVQAKGAYVLNHHLGGIFSWELDADNGHILNAMHQGLGHTPLP